MVLIRLCFSVKACLLEIIKRMYVCMYVCMYICIRGGPIGPCIVTYSGLLCCPFYSSPQQSCTSNKTQDLVRGDIEIVTWFHKVLTPSDAISDELRPHIVIVNQPLPIMTKLPISTLKRRESGSPSLALLLCSQAPKGHHRVSKL
jgi:hypothetical protein